uniref:UPAR/Ly6 domain-containing protein n=1 Tax=Equus asinus asinus TaxID=83772 RepID=A0A8C4N274_EQUAS
MQGRGWKIRDSMIQERTEGWREEDVAVSCRVSGGLCPQPGEGEADPCPGRRRPEAEVPPAGRARQVLGRGCGPARVGQVPVERCCLADCPPPPLLPTPVPAIRPPKRRGPHCSQRRPEMKTALLLLVALAVAAGPAQALRCHVCSNSMNCKKPQTCSAGSRYCRTMSKMEPLSGNLVEKDCVESCTPTHGLQSQVSRGTAVTLCCQEDLCNENLQSSVPARTLPTGATLSLALALGLVALILGPSL